jgi:hypothetical protein
MDENLTGKLALPEKIRHSSHGRSMTQKLIRRATPKRSTGFVENLVHRFLRGRLSGGQKRERTANGDAEKHLVYLLPLRASPANG